MATTVILGTGIIGLSTAYYLVQHQPASTIHLVDSSPRLFASASGFAGGFVAKDWFDHSVSSLGALSFDEHAKLAEQHDGRKTWGYSRTRAVDYDPREGGDSSSDEGENGPEGPSWLKRVQGDTLRHMDDGTGTAIVDPLKLCQFLLKYCTEAGVQLHHPATALSVTTDVRGELASVRIGYTNSSTETEIPATRLLITSGAWTPSVFESLFVDSATIIPVDSYGGHSLVVKSSDLKENMEEHHCWSVYLSIDDQPLELYSRADGMIYIAGVNSPDTPLPPLATSATTQQSCIDELRSIAGRFISSNDAPEIVRQGLCFRPITTNGTPIVTRFHDEELGGIRTRPGQDGGVFIATGHGPWGISLSLGTGKVMAELMQGMPQSADITGLGLQ